MARIDRAAGPGDLGIRRPRLHGSPSWRVGCAQGAQLAHPCSHVGWVLCCVITCVNSANVLVLLLMGRMCVGDFSWAQRRAPDDTRMPLLAQGSSLEGSLIASACWQNIICSRLTFVIVALLIVQRLVVWHDGTFGRGKRSISTIG